MVGKVYPSEKHEFKDPETGARIIQYTKEGKTNRTLYFTNRPYLADGEHIVFLSDRTGSNQMFLLHLKSGKITQLTDVPGQRNVSNCIHPTRPELYFRSDTGIFRVNVETLKTEQLLEAPKGWGPGILNLNSPPWLAFELIQETGDGLKRTQVQKDPGPVKPTVIEQFFRRPSTVIYRYNVDTHDLEPLHGEHRMLTHIQISPTDPNLLIFSDWANLNQDRCQFIDLAKRVKSPPRSTFPESKTARAGHENFTRKGNLYAQWMEGDLERDGDHKLYHVILKIGDLPARKIDEVRTARFEKYLLPENNKDLAHHFTLGLDETWGIHDRWLTAPTWDENLAHLSIFRHQKDAPQTIVRKLCFHNGHKGDVINLGAELTIDDKEEWATYTSFLGGSANVCQVDIRPFHEEIMKAKE